MSADFIQKAPELKHPFSNNFLLQSVLQFFLPKNEYQTLHKKMMDFGSEVINTAHPLGRHAETHAPTLEQYSAWGKRTDKINTPHSWDQLKNFSANHRNVAD